MGQLPPAVDGVKSKQRAVIVVQHRCKSINRPFEKWLRASPWPLIPTTVNQVEV